MKKKLEEIIIELSQQVMVLTAKCNLLEARTARNERDIRYVYVEHGWIGSGDGGPVDPAQHD